MCTDQGDPGLTPLQRRTLAELLGAGEGRTFSNDLVPSLRSHLESAIQHWLPLPESPFRLWKERIGDLERCEGFFHDRVLGKEMPFEYDLPSAAGAMAHACVELDVRASDELPPAELANRACERLARAQGFGSYWSRADGPERDEVLSRSTAAVERFRASFPSVRRYRRMLAPVPEQWVSASLSDRAVVLKGKVDLLLNAARTGVSTRVLVDLKSGIPRSQHAEDVRLYALIHTLRWGRPPLRVATFFLRSGEWQAEDVSRGTLFRAAERVIGAVRAASELTGGRPEVLRAGFHCGRCVRRESCPQARGRVA